MYMRIKEQVASTEKKSLFEQLTEQKAALQSSYQESTTLKERLATLESENQHLSKQLLQGEVTAKENHQKMVLQFENLSNKLLEQKSAKFTHLNKQEIEKILNPLAEKIKTFEQEVARTHREARDQKVALRTELERMHTLNTRMTKEANNLAQAIKGDSRVQGAWGEFILESLLDNAGLTKGREYIVQHSFTNEEGKRYQPDVIIKLPQNRSIVIDSKASLRAYEQYFHTPKGNQREALLEKQIQALKNHIKALHEKNYAQHYDLHGLDFVIMFIPLEPAFSLALQHKTNLFQQAYEQNVILASPATLLAILRTVAHLWKREYQNQYAMEIAQESGRLYDKFVGFMEDLKKIGAQLNTTQKTYYSALNKLSEGKGNLIDKAERIKALGARTKKQLPVSDQRLRAG